MRGISPVISFILIVMIALISTTSLYFFFGGNTDTPTVAGALVTVQVHYVNSSYLRVINTDAENTSSLAGLNTSVGPCAFPVVQELSPGVPVLCSFSSNVSGSFKAWAKGVDSVSVRE